MADQVYWEDVNEGDEIPSIVKKPNSQQLVFWAAASGDFYQIHYDQEYARGNNLKDIIVHGALKNAFLGQLLNDWAGQKGRIKRYDCSYRGMDFADQEIICKGVVRGKSQENGENLVELEIWTESGDPAGSTRPTIEAGQKTTPGKATVVLPSRG